MCHEQFHRARAWDREEDDESEAESRTVDELTEHWTPSHLSEEDEPDEDLDVLTDGGD